MNKKNQVIFALGCLIFFVVMAFDKFHWHTHVLEKGYPKLSIGYLFRSSSILIATFAICFSFCSEKTQKLVLISHESFFESLSIIGSILISVFFLIMFLFFPSIFNDMSLEDNAVEWLSALFLFGSCIIMVINTFKCHKLGMSLLIQISLAALGFVFFLITMEEVSWFQRVFEVKTPELFFGNYQEEINLHNFATDRVESAYYVGAFVFLVIFPFMRLTISWVRENSYCSILVAQPFIAVIGSVLCSYNFNMWNILPIQFSFWASIIILASFIFFSENTATRYIIELAIVVNFVAQVLFIIEGHNFERFWAITEYKELFIALGFFIYSLDVLKTINKLYLSRQ
jgi:hypothetical protein